MSYNRLSQLQPGDFDGASNLRAIYLNNNIIENINVNTFLQFFHIFNRHIAQWALQGEVY